MSTTRSRPQLTVIEGSAQPRHPLLRLPSTIRGPSPFNQSMRIGYRLAEGDVHKALEEHRRQPVLDLWTMVLGTLPPVPNISRYAAYEPTLRAQALESAHAVFRGVRRPVGDDPHGFDYFVFITNPSVHFRYVPDMVCVVRPEDLPTDVVLATYVLMDFPEGRASASRSKVPVQGLVTHWELIERDGPLPVHSKERYRQQLW
jgi:hypothetical protein